MRQRQRAEIQFWERYRDEVLTQTRVVDPACGSGAFLIAAFDFLSRKYEEVNERLAALKTEDELGEFVGQRSLFDLTKTILNQKPVWSRPIAGVSGDYQALVVAEDGRAR